MSNLTDFWKLPDKRKWDVINDLPKVKRPIHNRRCPKCRKPDARECFVDRQPMTAKADEKRQCDCECHTH